MTHIQIFINSQKLSNYTIITYDIKNHTYTYYPWDRSFQHPPQHQI